MALSSDTYADQAVVGIINQLDVIDGQTGDAVVTVLLYADQTVVVDVHHLVMSFNESLHGLCKRQVESRRGSLDVSYRIEAQANEKRDMLLEKRTRMK